MGDKISKQQKQNMHSPQGKKKSPQAFGRCYSLVWQLEYAWGCLWQVEGEVGERRIREVVINHSLLDFAGQVKDLRLYLEDK